MKYRKLEDNETVQAGDVYFSYGELVNSDATSFIGQPQSSWTRGYPENQWRRPIIKEDSWIAFSERKPTKEDGFNGSDFGNLNDISNGSILVFHNDGTVGVFKWDSLDNWKYNGGHTHWMPLNFIPREPTRIKVDGHEVVPNKDGSLKVGCQTVSSQDFEEIVRQRNEAMK